MSESSALAGCRAARMPKERLSLLAPLRRLSSVRIVETAYDAWVVWEGDMPSVVRALLPAAGLMLYSRHNGVWRPFGAAVPDFEVPLIGEPIALHRAVLPAPISAALAPDFQGKRVMVTLVRDARPRPATALRCGLQAVIQWCDQATSHEIGHLRGAVCGERVWVFGDNVPPLPNGERFWGRRLLTPLGFRPDPDWPEATLRLAAVVDDDEILALTADGAETLPAAAVRPLSRAAVRRLVRTPQGSESPG
jgi:GNAT superfamily N-acetyltransferase